MVTTEISKTKLVVKVHEPLIAIMQHKIDAACLKRDAYLDKALRVEAEFLRKEIATPNSDKAKSYIAAQLSDLKLKPLNLLLSTETVDLINEVCKEKNVPRDAFMNRFFLLLVADDSILTQLFLGVLEDGCYNNYLGSYNFDDLDDSEISKLWTTFWRDRCDFQDSSFQEKTVLYLKDANSHLSLIDELTDNSPFDKIRFLLECIITNRDKQIYCYSFAKSALQNLPEDYEFLKVFNSLGFNTFMTDELVQRYESKNVEITQKGNQDKLLAAMLKEKQLRAEKTKQLLAEKAKSAGEAK